MISWWGWLHESVDEFHGSSESTLDYSIRFMCGEAQWFTAHLSIVSGLLQWRCHHLVLHLYEVVQPGGFSCPDSLSA